MTDNCYCQKIGEKTISILIFYFHSKFTLWNIKLNIYVFDLLIPKRKSMVWKLVCDYCLQDFFASSTPHRVHTNIFLPKSDVVSRIT